MKFTRAQVERLLSELEQPRGEEAWAPSGWSEFIRREETPCPQLGALLAELLIETAEESPIRRGALIAGLTEHPGPAARLHLEDLLVSEDPTVFREDVVEALERAGNPLAGPALIRALSSADPDGDGWLECKIATALASLGVNEAVSLQALTQDPRENVAEAAKEAILKLAESLEDDSIPRSPPLP